MARTELPNGVILPAEYSDDWYEDMTSNLTKLDDVIGSDSEKLNADGVYFLRMSSAALTDSGTGNFSDLNSSYKIKTGDLVLDSGRKLYRIVSVDSTNETFSVGNSLFKVTAESDLAPVAESGDYGDLDNRPDLNPYDQHLANTDIHVTAADKQKWNNGVSQSYVLRYSSTAITDNSTIAYSTLDNTDNIKVSDKIIDSDGKIFSVVSIDSANETVTVGTALIDLALDADVMHLSGNETVAGNKTFADLITFNGLLYFTNSSVTKGTFPQSTVNPYRIYFGSGVNYGASLFNIDTSVSNTGVQTLIFRAAENVVSGDDTRIILTYDPSRTQPRYLSVKGGIEPNANNTYDCGLGTNIWKDLYCYHGYFRGQQQNDEYSGNARTNLTLLANRDTLGQSGCVVDTFRENTAQGTGSHVIGFGIKENSIRYEGCRFSWLWNNNLNGYSFSIRPTLQGANQAVEHNLGTRTNKWDTINGINPGALSFPDLSNGLDISGYFDLSLYTGQTYTPTVDGWISLSVTSPNRGSILCEYGDVSQTAYGVTDPDDTSKYRVSILIPCLASRTVTVYIRASGGSFNFAKFYPCQGSV